ncbi:MAG: pyridoxamine 5'-phosphate oxidase family protein [Desulfomonilaceae bacterium]|nr:pyridoxamine 5'-phosphate oxidase family protein [Desulfomonilaceae bacterium]
MIVSDTVKGYLARSPRINVLSTSSNGGEANVAMFGSPVLVDDSTVMIMLSENRTYANLLENPQAALLVVMPGTSGMQTEGCRLYLKVRTIENNGPAFDTMKAAIKARVGDSADILKHLVVFNVEETRPVVDMGQGI